MSLKDRSAILLGGHTADRALWWDLRTGDFVSSTYYGDELPPYVTQFNQDHVADSFSGKVWRRLLKEGAYAGCYPTNTACFQTPRT